MKLVDDDCETLIPLVKAAGMLGLDPSTLRQRKAGTGSLTVVLQGRKLFLVRSEVVAHRRKLIEDARRRNDVLRLVRR
jgi:hypothetical protein